VQVYPETQVVDPEKPIPPPDLEVSVSPVIHRGGKLTLSPCCSLSRDSRCQSRSGEERILHGHFLIVTSEKKPVISRSVAGGNPDGRGHPSFYVELRVAIPKNSHLMAMVFGVRTAVPVWMTTSLCQESSSVHPTGPAILIAKART